MQKTQKLKTKVRFTSLDVAAMVSNLQILIGMRATNIYDLNPSTYLIKIAKSQQKHYLLIENGVRFHTTVQKPDKKTIPSGFTMKFRKFLRSKRLQSIRQVGVQRVVVFTFGSQNFTNHLIIQLYSQGNIILTDNNYRILQCIRSHEFNQKVKTAVGQIYPFQYAANIYMQNINITQTKIDQILQKEQKTNDDKIQEIITDIKKKNNKKNNKKNVMKLKDFVFKLIPCLFPLVIQHILLSNQKNPQQKVSKQNKQLIIQGAKICFKFLKQYLASNHKGYLFEKDDKPIRQLKQGEIKPSKQLKQGEIKQRQYFQFCSYKNIKYSTQKCLQFVTFNQSVDEYFLHYKKTQHQQQQQYEQIAWKKYDQIKKDQNQRVKKLQQQQDIYKLKAEYIQKNISDIDAIIKIIKTMQDNGYSWDDITRMIAQSKKNGDPLANIIHQLNILKRQVTILLGDSISQSQMFQLLPVQINIDYNAYTNATIYYQSKKKNYQKQQRTKQASQQVLKIAQKDALKKIQKKKNQVFAKNIPQRKVFWFQKFNWFISSQGYLIISGRDSHQNQLVVKRYMKPGDLYMHSDYGGAASTVIKRSRKDISVPHATLQQAAIFTVCRSKAWDTKILSGAWWVYHDQVSKSAPTGEFLPTGSFMIRGKRNFIQPNRMEMGITLLFKVDNQSAQRHMNDRRIHEQQVKKQQQQMKRPIVLQQNSKQEQQFAIVSIDTQTRKQRAEQVKKQKIDLNLKKKQSKTQYNLKEEQKGKIQSDKNSDNSKSENGSDDQEQLQAPKKLIKKPSQNKNNKNTVKQVKKQQIKEPQQKHKQRNKKKLKKLQKYLQQQDEDERQIIMKMLGAKQMKHMKQITQVQQQQPIHKGNDKNNKKKKKDKKGTKKGIHKYIDMQSDEQQMKQKLNPDKVLFLKDKKKQQQQDKQLMQNSSQSDQQKLEQNNNDQNKQKQEQTQNIEEPQQKDQEQQEQQEKQEAKQQQIKQQEDQQVDQKLLDSQLGELYKLVGKPHPQDKFDCLVAMCAPYNSMKQNKFKIKLVPGGLKKGKAARNILGYFLSGQLSEQDKILLKSIPQQQMINAVIGNVKLAGAGLLKIQTKEKQQKKQKRKQEDNKKKEKEKQQ